MTEQEKQIRNHFLTLFIGECFHKWEKPDNLGDRLCKHCLTWEHDVSNGNKTVTNPDFYQPNDFRRLRKWMEENEPVLWKVYLADTLWGDFYEDSSATLVKTFNLCLDPSNLFEFLKEHREKWEWVKCPVMDGGDCIGNCEIDQHKQVAETVCKVRHPAAIYLDKEVKNV